MTTTNTDDATKSLLLPTTTTINASTDKIPKDNFLVAYIIYFTLGAGFILPWHAFITGVDYFNYLYPDVSVDRIFAIAYMLATLFSLPIIILYAHRSDTYVRINIGLGLFVVALLVVPVMDVVYIKGQTGIYSGFYVTVAATGLSGVADALVQGGLMGSVGELPERYMQALVAGTAASGVLVSFLRIFTKSSYSSDVEGLRKSAILYFIVGIVVMVICLVLYNVVHRLPVIKYYNDLKAQAVNDDNEGRDYLSGPAFRSTLWNIVGRVKWFGFGIVVIYTVTLSIFPGYLTDDVHSYILKDWYPILLITCYNVFDLVGKSLTAVHVLKNANAAIGASVARLMFYPLFFGCLHGPQFFRTEVPVTILTCLLGLTNGYFTSVLMILASKTVQLQHAQMEGIVIVLFLVVGLSIGSIAAWFWVI